jgi:glutaryl-CoA dehydrogenase (non-decarboxylating)
MKIELTPRQSAARASFRDFARGEVAPHAATFDRERRIPDGLCEQMARLGYWGATIPAEYGGAAMDAITYGLLHEEIGRACSSVRSLLTVHCMTAQALLRWGSRGLRERWLPRLASGETIAAFALTEPNVGSDAGAVETTTTSS